MLNATGYLNHLYTEHLLAVIVPQGVEQTLTTPAIKGIIYV